MNYSFKLHKKKTENVYLAGLEFGEDQLNKGIPVTFISLTAHLEKLGYVFDTPDKKKMLSDFARENFHILIQNGWDTEPHHLNTTGYFALLDYRELKEARESSSEARWLAIMAILISVAVGLIQIFQKQVVEVSNIPMVQSVQLKNNPVEVEVSNFPDKQNVYITNKLIKTEVSE